LLKKLLSIIPREIRDDQDVKVSTERLILDESVSGKKTIKKEFYTALLEIILELAGTKTKEGG
jgi:hypothetical protein